MIRRGESPTSSETRIVAAVGDVTAGIKLSLAHAEAQVARMDPSPAARLLTLTIEAYRRTVDSWSARPPTDDQIQLMHERVGELLRLAKTTSPTVRMRRLG